ncbi:MAG TPA: MmgE/PrpD family protein [Solirubrobacterales bacterium]|nr:MmgE/PrpD family protein [Solirubrobacterales bacterium]
MGEASLDTLLAELASELRWDDLPAPVRERARDRLLDALSTAVAGADVASTRTALAVAESGGPDGEATLLPTGGRAGGADAALVNGVAVHALLFEDINLASADHPGAVVVPAALAAAEEAARLGRREPRLADLLAAIVVGYEVQLHLGAVAAPGAIARGLRTTSLFGTVAAAAAAAAIWDLSGERAAVAVALGANLSGGLIEAWSHGTMEPYLQAGMAARNGLLAARLAAAGASAAPLTFTGANGFLRAFADQGDDGAEDPREVWRMMGVLRKPYPISGAKLGAVDSALAAHAEGFDPAAVRRVVARVPPLTKEYPGGDRKGPFATLTQAQDSTQFCVAAALLGRPMTSVATFVDGYADPEVAALTQVIEVVGEPGREPARIEVELDDGSVVVGEVDGRERQRPDLPTMAAKLRELTAAAWPAGRAEAVIELVAAGEDRPLAELSGLIRR